jgi:NAD(P)-dependent dehydrogenase (short-subunit alcohol dehydrogenase family)
VTECIVAGGGLAVPLVGDVASETDRERALSRMEASPPGFPSIVVNNAGIQCIVPFLSTAEPDFDRLADVHLKASFFLTQEVARRWTREGTRGVVLNIASVAGDIHFRRLAAYSLTKAGLRGMTGAVALELAPHGIRVNAIAPGHIDTDMSTVRGRPEALARRLATIPAGRLGAPDDVASLAAFLVSHRADYITGQTVVIDGGYSLR